MAHETRNDGPERIAPNLHAIPKVDPFLVPDGFFAQLPGRVAERIDLETHVPKVIPLWRRPALQRIAATFMLAIGVAYALLTLLPHTQDTQDLGTWSPDEQDLWLMGWDEPAMLADLAILHGYSDPDDPLNLLTDHETLPLYLLTEETWP